MFNEIPSKTSQNHVHRYVIESGDNVTFLLLLMSVSVLDSSAAAQKGWRPLLFWVRGVL